MGRKLRYLGPIERAEIERLHNGGAPAADLALYPEGSPEHIRAEHSAANTSRTVFELFGASAAEALREEAVKKWPKLGGAA